MTRLLNSKGKEIPVLIDSMGSDAVYIELRIFDECGFRMGSVHNLIDRDDAKTLAKNLDKWLKETEKNKETIPDHDPDKQAFSHPIGF